MLFSVFKQAVTNQFEAMKDKQLFRTAVAKDDLWLTYLSSFPPGTNPIYKERTEYDCQCCKQFIKNAGSMVAISNDGLLESIWDIDIDVDGEFQVVANALSALVKSAAIENIFLHAEAHVGTD